VLNGPGTKSRATGSEDGGDWMGCNGPRLYLGGWYWYLVRISYNELSWGGFTSVRPTCCWEGGAFSPLHVSMACTLPSPPDWVLEPPDSSRFRGLEDRLIVTRELQQHLLKHFSGSILGVPVVRIEKLGGPEAPGAPCTNRPL
jgi:hypothetical protein